MICVIEAMNRRTFCISVPSCTYHLVKNHKSFTEINLMYHVLSDIFTSRVPAWSRDGLFFFFLLFLGRLAFGQIRIFKISKFQELSNGQKNQKRRRKLGHDMQVLFYFSARETETSKLFQKQSDFLNLQDFQKISCFQKFSEISDFQKFLDYVSCCSDLFFKTYFPFPSILLQAQEYFVCGWQFVKPGFTCCL